MKYLKRYNEELDPKTYRSAADKLSKFGHSNRANSLKTWANNKAQESFINLIKTIGTFDIIIGGRDDVYEGEFYINIQFDKGVFEDRYYNWINGDNDSLYLEFDIGIVPLDKDFHEHPVAESKGMNPNGSYWVGDLQIHLGDIPDGVDRDEAFSIFQRNKYSNELPHPIDPNGTLYADYFEYPWNFTDRRNANKFRKALLDIFRGTVVYKETTDQPGGLKEEIIDFLISDNNYIDFDEFQIWLETLGRMNINRLYKD